MNRAERRKKLKEMTPFQYESRLREVEKQIKAYCDKICFKMERIVLWVVYLALPQAKVV